MDDLFLLLLFGLGGIFLIAALPWIVFAAARSLAFVLNATFGSVFQSYRAAGFRFNAWQFQRDLRAQASNAFRSSSFRSSSWGETPDREVLELGALLQKAVSNCN